VITTNDRNKFATATLTFVVTATCLAVSACGSGTTGGTSSSTTASSTTASSTTASSTTASSTTAAQGKYDQQAEQTLESIVQKDFASATAHFDSTMKEKLSAQALASAWDQYQQQFGTYESHGDPQDVARGNLTVVNIPLKMAKMPGEFRVTFHDGDGTIAGLYLLKSGMPVP
jgi:Protein of unknown function (DUF3887)